MAEVKVLVLRAPGTNCDVETCHALELVGARPNRVHVNALLDAPGMLFDHQVLVVPGGFCYGDDVAAGKILANELRIGLADELRTFRDAGNLILGICNGFQALIKSGLLPGWDDPAGDFQPATLVANDSGKFEDRWIHMEAAPGCCVFLEGVERLDMPIAHGEGKFVCRDTGVLDRLTRSGQVVLRYASRADAGSSQGGAGSRAGSSHEPLPYPINPNGSQANIAGICDTSGRVLGLMPHPERYVDRLQHPEWSRRSLVAEGDGLAVFRNAVRYFA